MNNIIRKYFEALESIYSIHTNISVPGLVCNSRLRVGKFNLRLNIVDIDPDLVSEFEELPSFADFDENLFDHRIYKDNGKFRILLDLNISSRLKPVTPDRLAIEQVLLEMEAMIRLFAGRIGFRIELLGDESSYVRKSVSTNFTVTRNGSELTLSLQVPEGQEPSEGLVSYLRVYGRSSDSFRGGYNRMHVRGRDFIIRFSLNHSGPIGVTAAAAWISRDGTLWVAGIEPQAIGGDPGRWDAVATIVLPDSRYVTALPGVPGRFTCPTCRCRPNPDPFLRPSLKYMIPLLPSTNCSEDTGQAPIVVPDPLSILSGSFTREVIVQGDSWYEALAALYALALARSGRGPKMGDIMVVDFNGPWIVGGCTCNPPDDPISIIAEAADVPDARSVVEIVEEKMRFYPRAWLTGIRGP